MDIKKRKSGGLYFSAQTAADVIKIIPVIFILIL